MVGLFPLYFIHKDPCCNKYCGTISIKYLNCLQLFKTQMFIIFQVEISLIKVSQKSNIPSNLVSPTTKSPLILVSPTSAEKLDKQTYAEIN